MAYYSHMLTSIKEIILYSLLSKKTLEKRVKIIGIEHLENALSKGKGVLVLTGHFGNWEFAPLFFLINLMAEILIFIVSAKICVLLFWIPFFCGDLKIADLK